MTDERLNTLIRGFEHALSACIILQQPQVVAVDIGEALDIMMELRQHRQACAERGLVLKPLLS